MDVLNLFYLIGVYDPTADDSWPWHCHYEDGRYLSAKHRVCGRGRAAEFASEDEARAFYFNWTHSLKYNFELIPVQFWTHEPDPPFPPEHPKSILKSIQDNEPYSISLTATFWFFGVDYNTKPHFSPKTFKKHREILMKYGIDVFCPPPDHLKITPEPLVINEPKKLQLTAVKRG